MFSSGVFRSLRCRHSVPQVSIPSTEFHRTALDGCGREEVASGDESERTECLISVSIADHEEYRCEDNAAETVESTHVFVHVSPEERDADIDDPCNPFASGRTPTQSTGYFVARSRRTGHRTDGHSSTIHSNNHTILTRTGIGSPMTGNQNTGTAKTAFRLAFAGYVGTLVAGLARRGRHLAHGADPNRCPRGGRGRSLGRARGHRPRETSPRTPDTPRSKLASTDCPSLLGDTIRHRRRRCATRLARVPSHRRGACRRCGDRRIRRHAAGGGPLRRFDHRRRARCDVAVGAARDPETGRDRPALCGCYWRAQRKPPVTGCRRSCGWDSRSSG